MATSTAWRIQPLTDTRQKLPATPNQNIQQSWCKFAKCLIVRQNYNKKNTRFFQKFRARELIASMHLITSTWFLCVFRQITFQINNALIVQVDIPLQASRGKGYWKNNVTCYENEAFLTDLETKWKIWKKKQKRLSLVEWWIQVKNKVKKLVIEHSARLKQENSAIENNLKQQLEQLTNSPNFKVYSELKKKLAKLQIESFRKKLLKNEQLFQYSNNLATKEFFKQFVQKRQNVTIGELIDDGGISKTTPIDLAEHVQRFYTKLYSCDQINPLEQNFFLNNLDVGLSDQQKEHLQNDLSNFEIETAISQMVKGKAPGPDGLSVEFYTRCWPIVKHDFVKLNQMYSTQSIDNRTKTGFITLIHKKGPKTKISNYRPISLLNYDLKNLHQMPH